MPYKTRKKASCLNRSTQTANCGEPSIFLCTTIISQNPREECQTREKKVKDGGYARGLVFVEDTKGGIYKGLSLRAPTGGAHNSSRNKGSITEIAGRVGVSRGIGSRPRSVIGRFENAGRRGGGERECEREMRP